MIEAIIDFVAKNLLWMLGIVIPLGISLIPKIRARIRKSFTRLMLKFQADDVGINATYVKNYERSPDDIFTNELFDVIKHEVSYDQLQKISLQRHFLRLHSTKLGMKLSISLESQNIKIEDEEYEMIPFNVTIEMDADIKGTSNIDHLDNFITTAEKIHEIIRIHLFSGIELNSSYVICKINNITNDMNSQLTKSQTIEDNTITYKNNSTSIKSYNPHNLTKILKKCVYA